MSTEEAENLGVPPDERRLLIRMDSAKANIAPPTTETRWFKLVGVKLGNQTKQYPHGDEVATVEPWEPVGVWSIVTSSVANAVLNLLASGLPNGQRYSIAPQAASSERAAWRAVLAIVPEVTERQARQVLAAWEKNGVIEMTDYYDPVLRKTRSGIVVIATQRPT